MPAGVEGRDEETSRGREVRSRWSVGPPGGMERGEGRRYSLCSGVMLGRSLQDWGSWVLVDSKYSKVETKKSHHTCCMDWKCPNEESDSSKIQIGQPSVPLSWKWEGPSTQLPLWLRTICVPRNTGFLESSWCWRPLDGLLVSFSVTFVLLW